MKKHCLSILFIGLLTTVCLKDAQAQILKWVLTTPGIVGNEVFSTATTINANVTTDGTNALNTLRRGDGLRNTNGAGNAINLDRAFVSTAVLAGGAYSDAIASNIYYEFYVSAKASNYLHCNSLVATIRRSSVDADENGLQWTYRIVDNADLGSVNDPTYNSNNPFKLIGTKIAEPGAGTNGVLVTTPISIEELQNVPAGKTVFFRLYVWGFANNSTNTFAVRSTTGGSTALSLEGTVDGVLPVELKGFKAQSVSKGIELAWQTLSERNNSHFEVLKVSGQKVEKIGEAKGAGNSETEKSYNFLDLKPTPGANYYQLRQVDFNGDQHLSEVASAKFGFDNSQLTAYANSSQVIINTYAAAKGTAEVTLNDISGRMLLKKKVSLAQGENSFSFPINLIKGTYVATVFSAENGKAAQKFIY